MERVRKPCKVAARSERSRRSTDVAGNHGPVLCRAMVAVTLLAGAFAQPCLGQRRASDHTLDSWSSPELGHPTNSALTTVGDQERTYKSLGSWIGFGLGAVAIPFAWSACENGSSCPAGEKTLIAGGLIVGGAFLGSLIGRQFKKGDISVNNPTPADSARRVFTDSLAAPAQ